jgi:two-component system response regulator AtoC
MSKQSVLVVDDDQSIRTYLSHFLTSCGYMVDCLDSGEKAVSRLSSGYSPSVVILDLMMPGLTGLEVLASAKKIHPSTPVIILSGLGQIKSVVEAMKMGASDYLAKPFEDQELELAIENVLEKQKLKEEVKTLRWQLSQYEELPEILSTNQKILRMKEIARHVADTDVPVLILGESGVGKEVVARYIHAQSQRHARPFIKVNCAALPHDLLESELFGHERGAFTGAVTEKPGKFELAHEGVLLLDEIGEMSPMLQAKLLHVLQDGEFSRLGAKRSIRVNTRILASTNRKLKDMVAKAEFREDLYFRLNVIRIEIPALRERREDIPLLSNYFLQKYRAKYESPVRVLPPELIDAFSRYDWPGNVRQLENAIKSYVILPDIEMILSELKENSSQPQNFSTQNLSLKDVASEAAERAEKEVVRRMLETTKWNRKQAAERLNISYKALLNKLKKWQMDDRGNRSLESSKQ